MTTESEMLRDYIDQCAELGQHVMRLHAELSAALERERILTEYFMARIFADAYDPEDGNHDELVERLRKTEIAAKLMLAALNSGGEHG